MSQIYNYGLAFLDKAALMPGAPALRAPGSVMTYAQLSARVVFYAHQLRSRGVDQHSCVALGTNRAPEGLALPLALALLGAPWVRTSRTALAGNLGITHALGLERPEWLSHPNFYVVDEKWSQYPEDDGPKLAEWPGYSSPDDTAYISQSSGTTGRPKLMTKTFRQALARMEQNAAGDYGISASCFAPLSGIGSHAMIGALLRGGCIAVGIRTFEDLLTLGVDWIKGSPAQIETFCRGVPPAQRVPHLYAAGSMVSPETIRRWLRFFTHIEIAYGSQEAGAVGRFKADQSYADEEVVYVVDSGVAVAVIDAAGHRAALGEPGSVRIKTSSMVNNYIGSTPDDETAFQDGWFTPGDRGVLIGSTLKILGRERDEFNFGGVKVNAADLDRIAEVLPSVRTAVAFGRIGENGLNELRYLVERRDASPEHEVARALRAELNSIWQGHLAIRAIYFTDRLPMTDDGKFSRGGASKMSDQLTAF